MSAILNNPTDEQITAKNHAVGGFSLKIEASPGSGKTSTLTLIAANKPREKGVCMVFGAANAKDIKAKMPSTVRTATGHAMAYGVGSQFAERLKKRLTGKLVAEYFNIPPKTYFDGGNIDIRASTMGYFAIDTLTRYCQSDSEKISLEHAPWKDFGATDDRAVRNEMASSSVVYARKLWNKLIDLNCDLPITHDLYLKLWALSEPTIAADYIMLDEDQDTNGVILGVLKNQSRAQMIYVGDKHQAIFEWRGAANAMDEVVTQKKSKLTQSFRFGQAIADVANQILYGLKGINPGIRGNALIASEITELDTPSAIISRTNSVLVEKMMLHQKMGHKVGMLKGVSDIADILGGINDLKERKFTSIQSLSLFKSYAELIEYSESNSGGDLKPLIKQIDKYGHDQLMNSLNKVVAIDLSKKTNDKVDVILTTAHKSKGLEFPSVQLTDDFRSPGDPGYSEADANLLFVAASRACSSLDISGCTAIKKAYIQRIPEPNQTESSMELS